MGIEYERAFRPQRRILGVSIALWIASAAPGSALPGMGQDGWPTITRQPYIQMTTDDSAVIVWRTSRPILPIVLFGESPDALRLAVAPDQIVQRVEPSIDAPADIPRLHSADSGAHQYEAHIKGLLPDHTYYYAIFDFVTPVIGGDERHRFHTSPQTGDDRPSRFWVVGDSGNGSVGQHEGYQGFLNFLENEPGGKRQPVDAYIHVGDMAYTAGGDQQFSAHFFGVYKELLRNTCCWPSMGNHEGASSRGATGIGPYYDAYVMPTRGEAGGVPSGTEAYYAFDFGNIHFICLDSHDLDRSPAGAMAQWLRADLEEARADWLIAFWHHPPYTKGTHDSDRETQLIEMRRFIMPILENAGVDLVLCGHSHTYERSMLIDGAYTTPTTVEGVVLDDGDGDPAGDGAYRKNPAMNPHEGSVSVVAGHGRFAAQFYGLSPVMRRTVPVIGSFLLDIDGDVLTGRMLDTTGAVRDTFQIVKDRPTVPARIAHPWRPFGPGIVVAEREPGARRLEMFPLPAAPDAVVRYEINGDEVTELSPIYTTPIALAPTDRSVQARTFWNEGARASPATFMLIPEVAAAIPNRETVAVPVEHGRDDGSEDTSGAVDLNGDQLVFGNFDQNMSALRFTGLGVPGDVVVSDAHVTFHSSLGSFTPTELTLRLEESANPPAFDAVPFNLSARRFGADLLRWNPSAWGYNQRGSAQRTPNFAALLQRHIAQPGWEAGNALVVSIDGAGSRGAWAFDRDPNLAATLHVSLDLRDPITIAKQQPFVVRLLGYESADGTYVDGVQVQYRQLAIKLPGRGLNYEMEASDSLTASSWKPIPESGISRMESTTDGIWTEITARFPLNLLPDTSRHFFRLRITETLVAE